MSGFNWKAWALRLRRDIMALWIAARDPRTPLPAKIVAALVAAYAFSPIDLIPDFIPVLGLLDDLILLPLGIALAIRLVPPALMQDFRDAAAQRADRPRSLSGAAAVAAVWVAAIALAWAMFRRA